MSVQAPQEGLFSVEVKAIRPELCGAEAKRHLFAVDGLSGGVQKLCHGMMQNRVLGIPRLCVRDESCIFPVSAACAVCWASRVPSAVSSRMRTATLRV